MVDCGPVAPVPDESRAVNSPELVSRLRREGGYLLAPAPLASLAEREARRARLARILDMPVTLHSVRPDGRPIWQVRPAGAAESKGQQFIRECAEAGIPLDPDAARAALGFDESWAELERRRLVAPITEEEPPVDPTTIGSLVSGVTGLVVAAGATMANRSRRLRADARDDDEMHAEMARQVAALQAATARMKGLDGTLRKAVPAAKPAQVQRSGAGSVNVQSGGNVIVNGDMHVHHAARPEADVRADLDAAHARANADRRAAVTPAASAVTNLARAREAEVTARRSVRRANAEVTGADDARLGAIRRAGVLVIVVLVLGLFVSPWLLLALLVVISGAGARMRECQAQRRKAVLLREDAEEDHGLALALLLDLEAQPRDPAS